MKGNDGKAARRRMTNRVMVIIGSIFSLVFLLCVTWIVAPSVLFGDDDSPSFGGRGLRRNDDLSLADKILGRKGNGGMAVGMRQTAQQTNHQMRQAMQRQLAQKDEATLIKEVLSAHLELVDLTVVDKELARSHPNSYDGVYGDFCVLDWSRRKKDPSAGTYLVA